ncbi:MAG: hypothetical protein ACKOJI_12055 [Phycisphaerales bacterium]
MRQRTATICALSALLCGIPAWAQTPPGPEVLGAQPALTDAQRGQVEAYMKAMAERFASSEPDDLPAMRKDLGKLINDPSAKPPFKRELGLAVVKSFSEHAAGTDGLRTVNVFIMARTVATADTVDFIIDNVDPNKQATVAMRIAAAAQLTKAIEGATLSPPQLDALAKRLAPIAARESDWVVVTHEVEAMAAMLRRQGLSGPQAEAIAGSLATTVNDLAARVMTGKEPELVNALQRSLLVVRNQLTGVPGSARTKLLSSIAPSLEQLAGMKDKAPDALAKGSLKETFDAVVRTAGLLQKVRSTDGATR